MKPQRFELFGIASARFLLQRANENSSPIYSRISTALHELVTEHNHWFFEKEDTDLVGLRDRFSMVALHDDPQISGVIKANRKACLAVEKTLDLLDSGQVVDFRVHKSHHYSVVIAQNVFLLSTWRTHKKLRFSLRCAWKRCQNAVGSLMRCYGNRVKTGIYHMSKWFYTSNACWNVLEN